MLKEISQEHGTCVEDNSVASENGNSYSEVESSDDEDIAPEALQIQIPDTLKNRLNEDYFLIREHGLVGTAKR